MTKDFTAYNELLMEQERRRSRDKRQYDVTEFRVRMPKRLSVALGLAGCQAIALNFPLPWWVMPALTGAIIACLVRAIQTLRRHYVRVYTPVRRNDWSDLIRLSYPTTDKEEEEEVS